jgi:hypothetical protein
MTTVAIYHRTVPNAKNQEKIDLLRFFSEGVATVGDTSIDIQSNTFYPADVGVIQGWISQQTEKPHLTLRNQVIQEQLKRNKHVVAVDSNLFLYANPTNPLHYLRYSFNGVFPSTGIYCDTWIDPSRWQKISQNLNLALKDYRTNGNHILLLLQRNGGWSMGQFDVQDWCNQTIAKIRKYSHRPIVVRAHPGDRQALTYLDPTTGKCRIPWSHNITLSTNTNLLDDLKNCWAAVNHNSSPSVGAAIEGYPVFVTDTARSQCKEIANTDLSQIETPQLLDRQQWVERLSMFHWNFSELRSGECWRHMREFI